MAETTSETRLLDRAEQAHRGGRFAQERKLLTELRSHAALTTAEQQRAAELWARLSPDPLVAGLIAVCVILFFSVAAGYWH